MLLDDTLTVLVFAVVGMLSIPVDILVFFFHGKFGICCIFVTNIYGS